MTNHLREYDIIVLSLRISSRIIGVIDNCAGATQTSLMRGESASSTGTFSADISANNISQLSYIRKLYYHGSTRHGGRTKSRQNAPSQLFFQLPLPFLVSTVHAPCHPTWQEIITDQLNTHIDPLMCSIWWLESLIMNWFVTISQIT